MVVCGISMDQLKGKNRNWYLGRDMDHLANRTAELRQGGKDCYVYTSIVRRNFVVVVLLFYVHVKHLRSCRHGQLT